MVDLDFSISDAQFAPYSATPLIAFDLTVTNRTPQVPIQNVSLQCQIKIEPTRRQYQPREQDKLLDLFGEPPRWGETLNSFLWSHAAISIPPFDSQRDVELPVPCSFDFNLAATKYFAGLENGEAPLTFLFSGTIFYRDGGGRLQIEQISWSKEANYRLPVKVWRTMMDHYYPDAAWLQLDRTTFEALYAFKRRQGLPSFEQAVAALLAAVPAAASPEVLQ